MERHALLYVREAYVPLLRGALDMPCAVVTTRTELLSAITHRRPTIVYVDLELTPQVEGTGALIVGIVDGALEAVVRALAANPWLSHVVAASMLGAPAVRANLARVHERLVQPEQHVLGATGVGRAALLASSERRESRLERMREFFASQDLPRKSIAAMSDVAEELMTNALYDAPLEAGYFSSPISRTVAVELPPERACEISYGVDAGSGFIRIRDPFGALSRARMLAVLERCNATGVALDESRGGAGLGLWRVFSTASAISISVIPGRLTDILVWIATGKRAKRVLTEVHLFFPDDYVLDGALGRFAAEHDHDLIDDSFTALLT